MRPGRLDRILYVSPPDLEARKHIFKIQFGKMAVAEDVDEGELAELVRSKGPLSASFTANLEDELADSSFLVSADRRLLRSRGRLDLSRRRP